MSEPSKEAVEALGKSLGEMSAMGYVEVGPEELTKALQAALPIERQRWEQEYMSKLRERSISSELLDFTRKQWEQEVRERLLSAINAVKQEAMEDGVTAGIGAAERIRQEVEDTLGEAEPVGSGEGHVCDPERPCEPNDHLCKNYLRSKQRSEAEPVEEEIGEGYLNKWKLFSDAQLWHLLDTVDISYWEAGHIDEDLFESLIEELKKRGASNSHQTVSLREAMQTLERVKS